MHQVGQGRSASNDPCGFHRCPYCSAQDVDYVPGSSESQQAERLSKDRTYRYNQIPATVVTARYNRKLWMDG